jgi:hypothetical protein
LGFVQRVKQICLFFFLVKGVGHGLKKKKKSISSPVAIVAKPASAAISAAVVVVAITADVDTSRALLT